MRKLLTIYFQDDNIILVFTRYKISTKTSIKKVFKKALTKKKDFDRLKKLKQTKRTLKIKQ